jgi:hypothetical protein
MSKCARFREHHPSGNAIQLPRQHRFPALDANKLVFPSLDAPAKNQTHHL